MFKSGYSDSKIIQESYPILLYGKFTINVLCITWTTLARNKILSIPRLLHEVDVMFATVCIRFDYAKLRLTLILYIIFITLMEVFLIFLSYVLHLYYNKHMDFFNNLIIFWSVNLFSIFLSQVIWFIVAVNQRLGAINFLLRNKKTITAHQLKIISKVHLKITKTIETMNESYCLIMMIFIGGSFCMFNLFLFHVKSFIFSSNAETLPFFLGKILIHIYSFALTLMVIVVASRTPNEARRITRTLFEMIQKHEDEEEMNFQLFNLIQQISLSQNEFSCGLFIFNWKLCFKFLSASLMYLVILIQFEFNLPVE